MVLNKVLPAYMRNSEAASLAAKLRDSAVPLAEKLLPEMGGTKEMDVSQLRRVLSEVGKSYLDYRVVAQREAEEQAELASVPETLVTVPFYDTDVYDMAGLLRLGECLWGD
jgi:hypothetical protein